MTKDRQQNWGRQAANSGRLLARPGQVAAGEAPLGLQPLGLDAERGGLLKVPFGYRADRPAPLVLMLHGAGGNARQSLAPFLPIANVAGFILLAPDSRLRTWDIIQCQYGPDIAFIDQALEQTFSPSGSPVAYGGRPHRRHRTHRYAIDPNHIAIAGNSSGASYALSVGITNGDLFTRVIAFSPGFIAPAGQQGMPRLFISHGESGAYGVVSLRRQPANPKGTRDSVLPIGACSRKIVPQLQRAGYDVLYREFDGSHIIPPRIALSALAWFTCDLHKGIWGSLLWALFALR